MSSKTVWTPPPFGRYDHDKIVEWAAEQGFDARNIAADGFRITQEPDGTYVAHGLEFERDENGHCILAGDRDGYRKHEWSHPVSSLPEVAL